MKKRNIFLTILFALLTFGTVACNGNGGDEDTGTDNGDTGVMDTSGGDTGNDVGGDADAAGDTTTSDAGETGPTEEECLGGDPLSVFCTGDVRPECQQYCDGVDAGNGDAGNSDGGSEDTGS